MSAQTVTGPCGPQVDYASWTPQRKQELQTLFSAWQDASIFSFFWTWRIGADVNGVIPNPLVRSHGS